MRPLIPVIPGGSLGVRVGGAGSVHGASGAVKSGRGAQVAPGLLRRLRLLPLRGEVVRGAPAYPPSGPAVDARPLLWATKYRRSSLSSSSACGSSMSSLSSARRSVSALRTSLHAAWIGASPVRGSWFLRYRPARTPRVGDAVGADGRVCVDGRVCGELASDRGEAERAITVWPQSGHQRSFRGNCRPWAARTPTASRTWR